MKITIDELINMNKNEMPKRIKIENDIFIYDNKENDYIYENGNISLFTDYMPDIYHLEDLKDALNQQVEILEEEKKIPEKLDYCEENTFMIKCKENSYLTREEIRLLDSNFKELGNKINSIIDYLKSKGDE